MQQTIFYGNGVRGPWGTPFEGVIPNLERRLNDTETGEIRSDVQRFLNYKACPECHGARLKKEMLHVEIGEKNIFELTDMSVDCLLTYFNTLALTPEETGNCRAD